MRIREAWNEGWEFAREDRAEGFTPVRLPHSVVELPYADFSERDYQIVSTYRRRFSVDPSLRGLRPRLRFEGAMCRAAVSLNGIRLAEHRGGYAEFRVDLGAALRPEGENELVVELDSREDPGIPPFGGVVDYLAYGGLYREATMDWLPACAIADLLLRSEVESGKAATLRADVRLDGTPPPGVEPCLRVSLYDPDGRSLATAERRLDDAALEAGRAELEISGFGEPPLWDLDAPRLCRVVAELVAGGRALDRAEDRFGFRRAEFRAEGFFLNGRRVPLRGLNRHQSYPYVGYAMPRSVQRDDADILKRELGVNIVRSSHYPPSRHFLDRCDEIGLLCFVEIPGWQHIGGSEWKELALEGVREMILQGYNHPCIPLWGVRINESPDDDELYARTNALARELDPGRQTSGVRNFAGSRLLEDVYAFNDFSLGEGREALKDPAAVAGKGVPYLVTEHNGHMFPTKRFDPEERRTEQALRHLKVLDTVLGQPGSAGAIGWCMADYNTHRDFGSGDRICYHGVLDMFRIPKTAAGAYASQRDSPVYLEVASALAPGEHSRANLPPILVLTNCDYVELRRNGERIGRYYPDRKAFPHLAHPPVMVGDFIGDRLEREEAFSPRDAARVKAVLRAVVEFGESRLPPARLLDMAWVFVKRRLSYRDGVRLFEKYVANWGQELLVWEFAGFKGGAEVARAARGPHDGGRLEALPDRTTLVEGDTYDALRVVLRHVDERGNLLPFSAEALRVETEGPIELIGPATFSLLGGSRAFWIRSAGRAGPARAAVMSDRFATRTLEFEVRKDERRG
jgi:beta-galactosidase